MMPCTVGMHPIERMFAMVEFCVSQIQIRNSIALAESQKCFAEIREGPIAKICGILDPAPYLFRREHKQEIRFGKLGIQIIIDIP